MFTLVFLDELLEKNRASKAMAPSTLHEDEKLESHGDVSMSKFLKHLVQEKNG